MGFADNVSCVHLLEQTFNTDCSHHINGYRTHRHGINCWWRAWSLSLLEK